MKKIILGVVAGFAMLVSCEKEDPLNPSEPAQACFSVLPEGGSVGDQFSFTNCSENSTSFSWDFGDGETSTQQEPTHTYSQAGTFEVKLLAGEDLDLDGILDVTDETSSTSKTVTVTNPPHACFTVSSESGKVGSEFTFANCSEYAAEFSWDFGDGNNSVEQDPTHVYEEEGSYEVVLYAGEDINGDGTVDASDDADSFTETVTVLPRELSAELTIKDATSWTAENGNLTVVAGANVDVYVSSSSFEEGTPDFTAVSDENGKVTFYELSDDSPYGTNYYIVVTKEDLSNIVNGLAVAGVFQSQAEIAAAPEQNPEPSVGDLRFSDMDGDGMITSGDELGFGQFLVHQGQITYSEIVIGN